MFKVEIRGRDLKPSARLLEALTRAGLLTPNILWEDQPDSILLTVNGGLTESEAFRSKGFQVKE